MPSTAQAFDPTAKAVESLQLTVSGLAQGASYSGVEAACLGSVRLQVSGSRLVAMARPAEVPGYLDSVFFLGAMSMLCLC